MDATYILGVILTILGGIALAVQSGVNASLGSSTGSKPFASVISFAMGTAICLLYLLIDTAGLKHQLPSAAGITGAPWWAWIGGALGAYYVVVVIIFAQKLGAGTLVGIFVCAQLITSIVLDLTGLVGFAKRVFSWQRWLGAAFMVIGVVLIAKFPGDTVDSVQQQQAKFTASGGSSLGKRLLESSSLGRRLLLELGSVSFVNPTTPAAAAGVDATARVLTAAAASSGQGSRPDLLINLQDRL